MSIPSLVAGPQAGRPWRVLEDESKRLEFGRSTASARSRTGHGFRLLPGYGTQRVFPADPAESTSESTRHATMITKTSRTLEANVARQGTVNRPSARPSSAGRLPRRVASAASATTRGGSPTADLIRRRVRSTRRPSDTGVPDALWPRSPLEADVTASHSTKARDRSSR